MVFRTGCSCLTNQQIKPIECKLWPNHLTVFFARARYRMTLLAQIHLVPCEPFRISSSSLWVRGAPVYRSRKVIELVFVLGFGMPFYRRGFCMVLHVFGPILFMKICNFFHLEFQNDTAHKSSQIIEGSLEAKLPTIWKDENAGQLGRSSDMEKVRREKMQVREKVGTSRNTVFFQCLWLRRVEK